MTFWVRGTLGGEGCRGLTGVPRDDRFQPLVVTPASLSDPTRLESERRDDGSDGFIDVRCSSPKDDSVRVSRPSGFTEYSSKC